VQPIYGDLAGRVFCPLKDLERLPAMNCPKQRWVTPSRKPS